MTHVPQATATAIMRSRRKGVWGSRAAARLAQATAAETAAPRRICHHGRIGSDRPRLDLAAEQAEGA